MGRQPYDEVGCKHSKTVTSPTGNTTYGKIEPKSRKTDTFKAFAAAECVSEILDVYALPTLTTQSVNVGVYTY